MPESAADRNLLFGLLAVQLGFLSREDLLAALRVWTQHKSRPLADILRERQALAPPVLDLLAAIAVTHQELHGGDVHQSLATLSSIGSLREDLRSLATLTLKRPSRSWPPSAGSLTTAICQSTGRRPAVPHPAAARQRRPGRGLRRPGRGAAPRGGPQGDPGPATPTTPTAAAASCWKPRSPAAWSIRASCRSTAWAIRRRPAVLRHAVHPRRQPARKPIEQLSRQRRGRPTRPAANVVGVAQAAAAGSSMSATPSTTPTAAACCTAI